MATPLSANVENWRSQGSVMNFFGLDVFVREAGSEKSENVILLLHGFPSSSYDFWQLLPLLGEQDRFILLDFPGFGLSAKPKNFGYSLFEQADIVEVLLQRKKISSAHILAHDMSTSIACELMARRERGLLGFSPRSLILMNGSVFIELASLTVSQKLLLSSVGKYYARLASAPIFKAQLRRILGRPIGEPELDAMWEQLMLEGGSVRLSQSIHYIEERYRFHHRWVGALQTLDLPTLVLWGDRDPVAVKAIAEAVNAAVQGSRLEWLEGLGHYPQLEDPVATSKAIRRFLESQPR